MQSYGEDTEWNTFKMIPIKEFMEHFDPNYEHVLWEAYYQNELDMIASDKLAILKK